jgi:hypothetical protein
MKQLIVVFNRPSKDRAQVVEVNAESREGIIQALMSAIGFL